jgi:hypothetical protein
LKLFYFKIQSSTIPFNCTKINVCNRLTGDINTSEHWPKTLNYNLKYPRSYVELFNIQKVKKIYPFFVLLSNMKIILSVSQSVCRYLNFPQIIRVCMSVSQSVNSQKTKSNLKQQFSTKGKNTSSFLGVAIH